MSAEPTPVTPAVEVMGDCLVQPVTMDGVTYSLIEGGPPAWVKVTAIPDEGYLLVPDLDAGWAYDPHAPTVSTVIECGPAPAPDTGLEFLPATGIELAPALALVALALALAALGLSILTIVGARRG